MVFRVWVSLTFAASQTNPKLSGLEQHSLFLTSHEVISLVLLVWNGLAGTGWFQMCTFTGLELHMGQPDLSVWSFILKKLLQPYSHVGCVPREQKQKHQDILRLSLRAYPKSLLLHSVTQRKSQGQPILNVWWGNDTWFLIGGTAKNLWLLTIYNTFG